MGGTEQMKTYVFCLTVCAVASAWTGPVVADAALDSVRNQLNTAAHLIDDSSAAKRVTASGNSEAQALHEQARALFTKAREALDEGKSDEAKILLSNAKKMMFKAVQTAGSGGARVDKAKRDYEMRALSILALLKAQSRVIDEKHAGEAEQRLHWQVETLLEDAGTLYQNGDYAGGRKLLDQAYNILKESIERMRDGETLVNKVEFNTIEDEYKYYWDKTSSQFEAISMAARSVAGTQKEKMVQKFSQKMQGARSQASNLAKKGDFEGAIKVLQPVFKSAPFQLMSLLR